MFLHGFGEFLLSILTVIILKIPQNIIITYINKMYIGSVIVFIFIYFIFHLFSKNIIKIRDILNESHKAIYSFFIVATIGISLLLSKNINNWKLNKTFFANVITILIFGLIILMYMIEKYKIKKLNEDYEVLFSYINTTEIVMEKYQKVNHENRNQLLVLKALTSENSEATKFINELLNDMDENKNLWISTLANLPNVGLKGLIFYKMSHMINNKINVSINISKKVRDFDFKNIKPKEYKDICRIIGVLLDNAEEASFKSKEKIVLVDIGLSKKNIIRITISNTYVEKIEINKLFNNGYSTKGNNRGIGLSLVKDIVTSNTKLDIITETVDKFFLQHVYINSSK